MKTILPIAKATLAALVTLGALGAMDLRAQDENRIIENRNSSFYDNPLSRTYTGRAPFNQGVVRSEPAPTPVPAPAPRAAAPAPMAAAETCWGLVRLVKRAPATASVGETIQYELVATAQCDAADVVITDTISPAASYVKSEPEPTSVEGKRLIWRIPGMHRGEAKTINVWVKADSEGELVNCATVIAVPQTCVSTMIGKPNLAIEKTGPETAMLGSDVTYNVVVSNKGSTTAKNVVVTDTLPDGLTHSSGQKTLSFNVGDLGPNQSKSIPVTVKAAQRGKFCNNAVAASSNAGEVKAEACTTVVQPGLKVVKTGDKVQIFGRNATYQIVVSNVGDTTLTDVVVTDTAPAQTTIASATGASISGNQAVWNVPSLKAGEEKTFEVKLASRVAGNHCNGVTVTSSQGLKESSEACTLWKGVAGVLIEVVDDPDPIQVGEETLYTIKVTNQGYADINNMDIVANFPKEVTPISSDRGTVNGQVVNFPKVPSLASKQSVTYTIKGKGAVAGDSRLKVTMTADELTTPVLEEESTTVY